MPVWLVVFAEWVNLLASVQVSRLFDRLFKGKKAGAEIPLNVTGTYVNPLIRRRRIEQGQAPLGWALALRLYAQPPRFD